MLGNKKMYVQFVFPEEMEKQALLSHTDYGLAETSYDDKGDLVIRADVRLLEKDIESNSQNFDGKSWRGDLVNVILPHEITHVILDAVAKRANVPDLKIGSKANEEIVDNITPHDGLGKMTSYKRVDWLSSGTPQSRVTKNADRRAILEKKLERISAQIWEMERQPGNAFVHKDEIAAKVRVARRIEKELAKLGNAEGPKADPKKSQAPPEIMTTVEVPQPTADAVR